MSSADAADHGVVAVAALDDVVAAEAVEHVVAAEPADQVAAAVAGQPVGAGGALQQRAARLDRHRPDPLAGLDLPGQALVGEAGGEVDRAGAAVGGEDRGRRCSRPRRSPGPCRRRSA